MDRSDWWRSSKDLQLHLITRLTPADGIALCGHRLARSEWEDPGDDQNLPRCFACLLKHGETLSQRHGDAARWA